jgi:hypothetical protein
MRSIIIAFIAVVVLSVTRTLADYPPLPKVEATTNATHSVAKQLPATPPVAPTPVLSNEQQVWNFLMAQGFTRNQTAGIMGNLQQEHNFNTTDVAGGLGIAQWIGGRRANLIARHGATPNLDQQLEFVMHELNGVEHVAHGAVRAAQTVEGATIAFQNLYERCGKCEQPTRINYAYGILERY